MRGVVIHAPRDLRIDEVALPSPGPGEVRVEIAAGGICGSDLHYYRHGGFGVVRIKEPMVLGHEIAGTVAELGPGVASHTVGQRVAVNPSRPCGHCRFCREGLHNQCLDMRFLGSAMRMPHVQGGFCQSLVVSAAQAVPIADRLSWSEAAMAEPLAVCLHAARRAGPLLGKRVLVTGCGPIGVLAVMCARLAGASMVVATDIAPEPLALARRVGATEALDTAHSPAALAPYTAEKGSFDVLFEASGSEAAVRGALEALRPQGVIVQLGIGGDMTLPINTIVAKELQLRGTFRFDEEFALAVELMGQGLIDVTPLLSASIPFESAVEAFELASDRSRAMKVQLTF
ncbi:MAG TPA: L-idonate 5-dehydrogenase [Geminicoccus sp.]|uniref:L-idonate 5-dehydrogenase n=1 Tax=Geminicoccus sp. TaxID=2024832 RepID=UPI002C53AA4B|nr:L-idonate 5-dehydrogenase [Geminicoccus sp.]HWL71311.1 L-idonate 5-dehydrogenase [Geminicoccus sp.]